MKYAALLSFLWGSLALAVVTPANANELVIRFDLSDSRLYELIAPVRRSCIAEQIKLGHTRDEAIELASDCIGRRFLLAAEFERVLRVYYPSDITNEELASCVREGDEEVPLLKCVRAKM